MWMMLELALRIKISTILDRNPRTNVSKFNKIIYYGQLGVTIFMLVTFSGIVSYAIYVYADADKQLDDKLFYEVVGYFFLGTFVLMAMVNGYLICKMKEKNKSLN